MADIRIGTSEKGGTFWSQGKTMALLLERNYGITLEVIDSKEASIENAQKLDLAEIDFGFMASNWIGRAYRGEPPFSKSVDLRVLAPANSGAMFFITKAKNGITHIRDLVGKKVAIGSKGSGMVQHVKTIFQLLDISFDDFQPCYLNFEKGGYALEAGEVDAQWQCPFPNQVMEEISKRMEVRVLEYDTNDLEKILNEVNFYRPSILAEGLFEGLDRDSRQLGVINLIAVHSRTNEEVVKNFVTMILCYLKELEELNPLFKNLTQLFDGIKDNGMSAIEYGGTPVHNGAIQAYRDQGYLRMPD